MKRLIATLLVAIACSVGGTLPAHAEPISTFLIGLGAGFGAGAAATGAYLGTLGAGFAVGQFLAANIGTLLLAGATLLFQAFQNKQMEQSRVNFRQAEAPRRHARGLEEVGGSIAFGEFDANGAFWYIVLHCDEELMELEAIKFDDIIITKDGSNTVTTEEFIALQTGWFSIFSGKKPYFKHWLCTFSSSVPSPDIPAEFKVEFPEWTVDHKLAGITCSVIKIDPILDPKDEKGVYRWRGAIGLGEPACSIIGIWDRIYDPRDPAHDIDDPSTWGATTNLPLIAARHRTAPEGFNMPMDEIAWAQIADEADWSDLLIEDRDGNFAPMYAGGGVWDEERENALIEQDIMAGCDGLSLFDSEGRWYIKVGRWEEPQLLLTADRDIVAMQDADPTDGENELDGVIVKYKDSDLGHIVQPSAPWRNPLYYEEGRSARYKTIDIPVCKNHNQAVRLAKAYGLRTQPAKLLNPQTWIRGRRAKRDRIVGLNYDATISGNYQITQPVEMDAEGATALLSLAPVDANNWILLPGEEGERPVGESIAYSNAIPDPTGVSIDDAVVETSTSAAVRLEVTFDVPARAGDAVEVQYASFGSGAWFDMTTSMAQLLAYSEIVSVGATYDWRYRMKRGNRASDWVDGLPIHVASDPVAPGPLTSVSVAGSNMGRAVVSATAPASANMGAIAIYRVPAGGSLNRVTHLVAKITAAPSEAKVYTDGDATRTNMAANPNFDDGSAWSGTNWTISGGKGVKAAPGADSFYQSLGFGGSGQTYRAGFTVTSNTTGTIRLTGQGNDTSYVAAAAGNGLKLGSAVSAGTHVLLDFEPSATWDGAVDEVVLFEQTITCAPQGIWDYHIEAENGAGLRGPTTVISSVLIY